MFDMLHEDSRRLLTSVDQWWEGLGVSSTPFAGYWQVGNLGQKLYHSCRYIECIVSRLVGHIAKILGECTKGSIRSSHLDGADGDGQSVDDECQAVEPQIPESALAHLKIDTLFSTTPYRPVRFPQSMPIKA